MAFCTAADVETFAQIDFNSALETVLTNEIIPIVEDVIRDYLGYDVDYATHTETMSGNQTRELFLEQRPVIAVTSVTEDDSTLEYGNQKDFLWYENGSIQYVGNLGMNSIAILSAADLQLLGKFRKNFFI